MAEDLFFPFQPFGNRPLTPEQRRLNFYLGEGNWEYLPNFGGRKRIKCRCSNGRSMFVSNALNHAKSRRHLLVCGDNVVPQDVNNPPSSSLSKTTRSFLTEAIKMDNYNLLLKIVDELKDTLDAHTMARMIIMATERKCINSLRSMLDVSDREIINQVVEQRTALHIATARGWKDGVEILIEHGADTTLLDGYGNRPIDIARKKEYQEIIPLLSNIVDVPSTECNICYEDTTRVWKCPRCTHVNCPECFSRLTTDKCPGCRLDV